jgi:pimeloyl-ACP methyl ester carboxylesterase/class 3 adenylate cyclase
MDAPIRYASNGGVHIAYQVVGDGPFDMVYTPGIWSHLEIMWEWPAWRDYLLRLSSFCRLVLFDMRGCGLSDRGDQPPILELQADDLRAVMDTVGSRSAAVFGGARGAAMTMLFAAAYPERVRQLVLYAPVAKTVRSADWPYGMSEEEHAAFRARFTREMGTGQNLDLQAPAHDHGFARWWARLERMVASPGAYQELARILTDLDVRQVLPHVQAPTLVLHRRDDRIVPAEQGRAVAERIAGARFVEFPGRNHIIWMGDWEPLVDEVAQFLTGTRPAAQSDRVLATVLFTDIVQSTEHIARLGDRRWKELLAAHRAAVRGQLSAHRGIERDTAGDGFMATFDGPARAVRCADAIIEAAAADGLQVRAGLHTGECELLDGGLTGLAVHIAARIAATAAPGEVRVSSTVRDLVAGSGIRFTDLGMHALKGVDEEWRLLRLDA